MKYIVRLQLLAVLGFIGFGYFLKNKGSLEGDKWIGIGVLVLAFVLMPTFIYYRYRNKKLSDYKLNFNQNENKDAENQ